MYLDVAYGSRSFSGDQICQGAFVEAPAPILQPQGRHKPSMTCLFWFQPSACLSGILIRLTETQCQIQMDGNLQMFS